MIGDTTQPCLSSEEEEFLGIARKLAGWDLDWFAFEEFAFGMHSPVFSKSRSHHGPIDQNPVYVELRRMWLELGVCQGWVAVDSGGRDVPEAAIDGRRRNLTH